MDNNTYIEQCMAHDQRIKISRKNLQSRRDQLVEEICSAFKNVTRKGGVSLAEVELLDAGASVNQCKRIRAGQRDKHWSQVDLRRHDPYGSGLCFLDPIGFCYHLPAYLIDRLTIGNHLVDDCRHDDWMGQDTVVYRLQDTSSSGRKQYNLLNTPQRECVARFFAFEVELLNCLETDGRYDDIYTALKSYWIEYLHAIDKGRLESIWPGLFD